MLARRQIRIKVMQQLYAILYSEKTESNEVDFSKALLQSINDTTELYYFMLYLVRGVFKAFEERFYISKNKYVSAKPGVFDSSKLLKTHLFRLIVNSTELEKITVKKYKFDKIDNVEKLIDIILNKFKDSDALKEYLDAENNFELDKSIIITFFVEYVANTDLVYDFVEDYNINWIADFPIINTSILRFLDQIEEGTELLTFPNSFLRNKEDGVFTVTLFQKVLQENKKIEEDFKNKTVNWNFDRVANMDVLLIKMALVEVLHFPEIPVKVSINEYIDIAKDYSGPKSHTFINGVIDSVVKGYDKKKLIVKMGLGLK